jgi:hypothetical protein
MALQTRWSELGDRERGLWGKAYLGGLWQDTVLLVDWKIRRILKSDCGALALYVNWTGFLRQDVSLEL